MSGHNRGVSNGLCGIRGDAAACPSRFCDRKPLIWACRLAADRFVDLLSDRCHGRYVSSRYGIKSVTACVADVVCRSCCSMAAIIAPSYLQTPCSGGFFISRVWKPPGTMAQDSTQSRLFPWAIAENAPNRVVFFSPYGPFMEKSAFVCRKSRNPRVETPPQWA